MFWTPLAPPQKQKPARARRESGTPRMKTMRMTMRTMIRKAKLGSSFYRVSLLSTRPRRLPSYSLHRICNPPPALSSFYWGKTVLEGWAKWSCIVIKPPPLPMELRATQQPSTSLPQPRGSQASQHSAFHNFTVDPSLCISCEDFGTGI